MATQTRTAPKAQTADLREAPTDNLPAVRSRADGVAAIIPTTWQEVTAIASAICRAHMAPKSYCQTDSYGKTVFVDGKPVPEPDKVAIAIMHGLEVGFTPMASLQSIAVINGMPSIYGDGLLALIRASGLLEDVEETVEWAKDGPISATCKMWRKGEKTPSIQTYTRADAMKAKLWGKAGPWTDHPARMLQWRARGWCGRDKFADVLRGLRSAEEVLDMLDVTPEGNAATVPPEPKREEFREEPETDQELQRAAGGADPEQPPEPVDKSTLTDVEDLNDAPAELPVFEAYPNAGRFFTFADPWLQDRSRSEAELVAFGSFYKDYISERLKPAYKSQPVHVAMVDTKRLYDEAMKRAASHG